eukprot:8805521-Pyramimonas_sp.AAC.1
MPTPALAARISANFENVSYEVVPCDKGAAAIGVQVSPLSGRIVCKCQIRSLQTDSLLSSLSGTSSITVYKNDEVVGLAPRDESPV